MSEQHEHRQNRFLREPSAGSERRIDFALLRSEERFRLLVEAVHEYALVMLDREGRILCWNRGAVRMTGYDADDMLTAHFSAMYRQEDQRADRPGQHLQAAATHGEWQGAVWQRRKNGDDFLAQITITPIRDDGGVPIAFAHVTHDITTQKHNEDTLRYQAQQFRVMTEAVPGVVFTARVDGSCDYLNSHFYAYTGMPTGTGEGTGWEAAVHPHDVEGLERTWRAARDRGERLEQQIRLRRADGTFRWFLMRVCPARDGAGRITRWVGTCTDIHDFRITEEALRLAQIETHAGVWHWDISTDHMTWLPEYYDLYGLDASVVPSYENWLASIVEEDREAADRVIKKAISECADLSVQFRIRHPDNGVRCLLSVGKIACDAAKQPTSMAGITLDITPQKRAEDEIHRLNVSLTQRLDELQDKMQELEAFHEVVVGRELKMMALEKANEALERELQQLKDPH
ncbi:MAG TPA: PAS domain S-box protein [Nitrospiraceae bacterium]|nr:PAS domain S-box protein [Nitrospiraceae bacterium]